MKLLTLSLVALAALTAPALAACRDYPIVTPDNAPVNRTKVVVGGGDSNGSIDPRGPRFGSCNPDDAEFDAAAPRNRPGGYCDYAANLKSLSDKVGSHVLAYVTLDGVVADILRHRNGIEVGPVFIPLTGYIPGAC